MQQRQPRLGDILDDYCPRERRLTNHAVVAMVGDQVKQTRCTTCESEHEYKHAKVPRRRISEQSALYSQVLAAVTPKKVARVAPDEEAAIDLPDEDAPNLEVDAEAEAESAYPDAEPVLGLELSEDEPESDPDAPPAEEGPVHRQLIRAQLPKHEGQVALTRQAPDFTIRQPAAGRPNRFRPRQQRAGQFQANRPSGGGNANGNRAANSRPAGRPNHARPGHRPGAGRNRSK